MARRKKIALTQDQIDYRNGMLTGKLRSVKNAEKLSNVSMPPHVEKEPKQTTDEEIKRCFFFLNNSVYWINEYIDGNVNKARLLETAKAIQENARRLEMVLRQ